MMPRAPTSKVMRPIPPLILVILISLESYQAFHAPCPPGWKKWCQSCYIRLSDKMNWIEASEACSRLGSSLAVPDSQEENDFIWWTVAKGADGLWIGCTDAAEEGVWLCGGQPAKFTNWLLDRPKNNDQLNCARMTTYSTGGKWADDQVSCDSTNRKYAACEMTASPAPTYHTFTGPDGRVPQQCLLHHDIKNLTAEGVLACGWACWADPRCSSFNLWQSSKRAKMCQLNDVTRLGADDADFKDTDNCYYFDL